MDYIWITRTWKYFMETYLIGNNPLFIIQLSNCFSTSTIIFKLIDKQNGRCLSRIYPFRKIFLFNIRKTNSPNIFTLNNGWMNRTVFILLLPYICISKWLKTGYVDSMWREQVSVDINAKFEYEAIYRNNYDDGKKVRSNKNKHGYLL